MKKVDLAYLAGIFDGEGCIMISKSNKRYYSLYATLNMANEYIPNLLKFSFGGSVSIFRDIDLNHQKQWRWSIAARKAKIFLEVILPYLRLKRNEAELAIQFQGAVHCRGEKVTDEQIVVREAQRILMSKMKIKQ